MIPAIDQCAAVWKPLACTADDIALYAALTGAKNIREISELAGYVAQPGYRLIHVDDRLKTFGDIGFEIALVDDVQSSIAYYVEAALVRIPACGALSSVAISKQPSFPSAPRYLAEGVFRLYRPASRSTARWRRDIRKRQTLLAPSGIKGH